MPAWIIRCRIGLNSIDAECCADILDEKDDVSQRNSTFEKANSSINSSIFASERCPDVQLMHASVDTTITMVDREVDSKFACSSDKKVHLPATLAPVPPVGLMRSKLSSQRRQRSNSFNRKIEETNFTFLGPA